MLTKWWFLLLSLSPRAHSTTSTTEKNYYPPIVSLIPGILKKTMHMFVFGVRWNLEWWTSLLLIDLRHACNICGWCHVCLFILCGYAYFFDLNKITELCSWWAGVNDNDIVRVALVELAYGCVLIVTMWVSDNMCMSTEPLHGEVITYWSFCGGKVGGQWGVWEQWSVQTGWGWGKRWGKCSGAQ